MVGGSLSEHAPSCRHVVVLRRFGIPPEVELDIRAQPRITELVLDLEWRL